MRSSQISIGDNADASQYNLLRDDAKGGSNLFTHEQDTPDLTLKVEAGVFVIGKTTVSFAGGNSPSFTAPSVNPRIDLLVINDSGVLSRVVGAEGASPAVPDKPNDKVVIAEVFNRVGQTTILDEDDASNGYIQLDARPFLKEDNFKVEQDGSTIYAADSESDDTYVITLDPVPPAYTVGMVINFKANTVNTGAATLNVNGLGAKTIKRNGDQDLSSGDIKADQVVTVVYDGTDFQMQSQTGTVPGGTKINVTTAAVTVSNTLIETNLLQVSIPGGILGSNNAIKLKLFIKNFSKDSGSLETIRLKYGSTTLFTISLNSVIGFTRNGYIELLLLGNGATNAQKASNLIELGENEDTSTFVRWINASSSTSAEDSTVAKNLTVTFEWNSASAGNTITMDHAVIEKII